MAWRLGLRSSCRPACAPKHLANRTHTLKRTQGLSSRQDADAGGVRPNPKRATGEKNSASVGCCGSTKTEVTQATVTQRFINAVSYGYGKMISDTAKWLVIGLVAAAVITALVPQSFFLQWGDGVVVMFVMVIVVAVLEKKFN